jgi:hypothetical protein
MNAMLRSRWPLLDELSRLSDFHRKCAITMRALTTIYGDKNLRRPCVPYSRHDRVKPEHGPDRLGRSEHGAEIGPSCHVASASGQCDEKIGDGVRGRIVRTGQRRQLGFGRFDLARAIRPERSSLRRSASVE